MYVLSICEILYVCQIYKVQYKRNKNLYETRVLNIVALGIVL